MSKKTIPEGYEMAENDDGVNRPTKRFPGGGHVELDDDTKNGEAYDKNGRFLGIGSRKDIEFAASTGRVLDCSISCASSLRTPSTPIAANSPTSASPTAKFCLRTTTVPSSTMCSSMSAILSSDNRMALSTQLPSRSERCNPGHTQSSIRVVGRPCAPVAAP